MTENADKNIEGLCVYIRELDSFRLPVGMLSVFYSLGLSFNHGRISYLAKCNPELYERVQEDLVPYFRKMGDISSKGLILFLVIWLCVIPFFSLIVLNVVLKFFGVNEVYGLLLVALICVISFVLLVMWSYMKRKVVAGKEYDYKLKGLVEDLVCYGESFVNENGLNPDKYSLKLKHKDYCGLNYDDKGENSYVGYFRG